MWFKTWVVVAAALSVTTLAGCDESEQGRILLYEKGSYLGQPDPALSEEQIGALRSRAQLQGAN